MGHREDRGAGGRWRKYSTRVSRRSCGPAWPAPRHQASAHRHAAEAQERRGANRRRVGTSDSAPTPCRVFHGHTPCSILARRWRSCRRRAQSRSRPCTGAGAGAPSRRRRPDTPAGSRCMRPSTGSLRRGPPGPDGRKHPRVLPPRFFRRAKYGNRRHVTVVSHQCTGLR